MHFSKTQLISKSIYDFLITGLMIFCLSYVGISQNFDLAADTPFYDVRNGAVEFADIDNDGDYDLLMLGNRNTLDLTQDQNYICKLYKNDGDGNFSEVMDTPFRGLRIGSIAFADIDGDNDQDVMITGIDWQFDMYTTMYINDGNGNFSESFANSFHNVYASDIVFADVDGDEDLDVFLSGRLVYAELVNVTSLYINDGAGGFIEKQNTPFASTNDSSMDVSDYDLDGDLDMILLGASQELVGPITQAYLNDGSGNYTIDAKNEFQEISSGKLNFSDIDNDGDDDILIAGTTDGGLTPFTGLYENAGEGKFILKETPYLVNLKWVSSMFFDFNNDGFEDLLMSGKNANDIDIFSQVGKETNLYVNLGNGTFEIVEDHPFLAVDFGDLAFADVNGDQLNDVFLMGTTPTDGVESHCGLYINKSTVSSTEYQNNDNPSFSIYPNPVIGKYLNLQLSDDKLNLGDFMIVDVLGQVIRRFRSDLDDNLLKIDISEMKNGNYFLILQSNDNTAYKQFTVIH